jgi:hypothetical protein
MFGGTLVDVLRARRAGEAGARAHTFCVAITTHVATANRISNVCRNTNLHSTIGTRGVGAWIDFLTVGATIANRTDALICSE